jgi:NTP pyrophosphatase (non-canonical NTP hydrolase)
MTYYLYHVPGIKIGVTTNIKERVENQQGYIESEYDIIMSSDDINTISEWEIKLQKKLGYRVDEKLYSKLKCNQMKINVTEMTTTFPCPVNKLKGHLMDNIDMQWDTVFGPCTLTKKSIEWIMKNVNVSKYSKERCYIYNRAFARWFDNNDPNQTTLADLHWKDNGYSKTITGALAPTGVRQCKPVCRFDKIRDWANERGLYSGGDTKTQTLKLMEEAGEICRAVLKVDKKATMDGIGDCVVVLTNLAELAGTSIEECIDLAYNEIKNRTGKMSNGTFKKD